MAIEVYDAAAVCPRCKKATYLLAGAKPEPGAITFCTACGCVSTLAAPGILREMSAAQQAALPQEVIAQIAWAEEFRFELEEKARQRETCQCGGCQRRRGRESARAQRTQILH